MESRDTSQRKYDVYDEEYGREYFALLNSRGINMKPAITLDPALNVKAIYGHDKEWWGDHLEKYCALNPDDSVYPQQILGIFGRNMNYAVYHQGINMAAKVVEFWQAHPSIEELLCKK